MAQSEVFEALKKHLDRFGPEGILEVASKSLDEAEYEALAKLVRKVPRPVRRPRSRRRGRR